ncbi:NAD(P)H-dependent oxidoreductase [Lysobacter silvisoli]|uniref:Flavodoxin family protein n=1 Tax=Lysobacter silvisoli TaxID=2293254 RepID=A0A371K2N9_9GAMM|nr:NAD(P)H-dependent oxidoreductase [Lysobacter silvisoli]RDZ28183.1 flavodoxin family protein [Lysobacter silvisoli]
MHTLIVVAHADPASLSHAVAAQVAAGIASAGPGHTCEVADLAAEGFDPRFGRADIDVHNRVAPPPADVLAEQARLDRADALVLVYPVFWWSMPALLKGWIDRVFANGWAYDAGADGKVAKLLRRLNVHLIGIGGATAATYQRRGYSEAMRVQIEHGIFDYCGARVLRSELLLGWNAQGPAAQLETARAIGRDVPAAALRNADAAAA